MQDFVPSACLSGQLVKNLYYTQNPFFGLAPVLVNRQVRTVPTRFLGSERRRNGNAPNRRAAA
jgi:hypothetical protein